FHHALGAVGPLSAAFVVSAWESGRTGPRELSRAMVQWRGATHWLAVALLAPYALLAIAITATSLVDGTTVSLAGLGRSREFAEFSAVGFLAFNIVSFGFGEEVGWRGYALPRLQARHSALIASLLLTVGWALWHLPLFLYRPGYTSMSAAGVVGWFFSLLTGAVLLTWLYNESRGSLLVVAVFHATIDVAFTSELAAPRVVSAAGALITLWGIVVLVTMGPRHLSRRGKSAQLPADDLTSKRI
ncbi:MAG: CPBP family intramembrane glutamic endopeptidase, partial [Gemmatimonas sp.]